MHSDVLIMQPRTRRRRHVTVIVTIVVLGLLGLIFEAIRCTDARVTTLPGSDTSISYLRHPISHFGTNLQHRTDHDFAHELPLLCPSPASAEDVILILRTGASAAQERLPAFFDTFLQCVPHYELYSDLRGSIRGRELHDVLDQYDDDSKSRNHEFEYYARLKQAHDDGEDLTSLTSRGGNVEDEDAWKLDKWKFLPMIERVWQRHPDKSWYVFIEDDTYLVWPNLLAYLDKLDPSESQYLGSQIIIAGPIFAHGGSGWAMSNTTMSKVVEKLKQDQQKYENVVQSTCCGDDALASVSNDAGVYLGWANEFFQGMRARTYEYAASNWCKTVLTYHHMSSDDIHRFWRFEQSFWHHQSLLDTDENDGASKDQIAVGKVMSNGDFFKNQILPTLRQMRPNWNNKPNGAANRGSSMDGLISVAACRSLCEDNLDCLQYSYTLGRCTLGTNIVVGDPAENEMIVSGWMHGRIANSIDNAEACE